MLSCNTYKTRHGGDFSGKPAPLRQTTKLEDIRFFQDVQPVFCRKKCARPSPGSGFSTSEAKVRSFQPGGDQGGAHRRVWKLPAVCCPAQQPLKVEALASDRDAPARFGHAGSLAAPSFAGWRIINGEIQQCRF
jgi:hypothetical protein